MKTFLIFYDDAVPYHRDYWSQVPRVGECVALPAEGAHNQHGNQAIFTVTQVMWERSEGPAPLAAHVMLNLVKIENREGMK